VGVRAAAHLVAGATVLAPEVLEPIRRQLGVAHGVLDVLVPEPAELAAASRTESLLSLPALSLAATARAIHWRVTARGAIAIVGVSRCSRSDIMKISPTTKRMLRCANRHGRQRGQSPNGPGAASALDQLSLGAKSS